MNRYILLLFLISLIATSSAFSQTPKTAEDFNNRGVSRRSKGDVEGAIEDFTKAISLKGLPITLVRQAVCLSVALRAGDRCELACPGGSAVGRQANSLSYKVILARYQIDHGPCRFDSLFHSSPLQYTFRGAGCVTAH